MDRYRRYNSSLKGRYRTLVRRAKRGGLPLEISCSEYCDIVDGSSCFYCNGPLPESGFGLDRKDNDKGYTVANVVTCCAECNDIKGLNLSHAEALVALAAVKAMRKL